MSDDLNLTCTNGDLWLALWGPDHNVQHNAFAALLAVPKKVLAVSRGNALRRAVEAAFTDIQVARKALLERYGTTTDGEHFQITDVAGYQADWITLMQAPLTLSGVQPLSLADFAPTAFVSEQDIALCGPLVLVTD